MENNKNYLILIILYLISFNIYASTKLNGMVVFPSEHGFFSAVINLENKFKGEYLTVRDGYAMDYYRYNLDHSSIFSGLDIKINHEEDRSFVLLKSLKPINNEFDVVLRLRSNKQEVLGVYKVVNNLNVNYLPNEINEASKLEQNKNEQLHIIKNQYADLMHQQKQAAEVKLEAALVETTMNKQQNELFSDNCYYVVKGDNITKIAKRMLVDLNYKVDMNLKQLIDKIYELNTKAFINGDINKLKQNCCLVLPKVELIGKKLVVEQDVNEGCIEKNNTETLEVIHNYHQKTEIKAQEAYHVVKGECLSCIAFKLKQVFPNKTWKEIMKELYENNNKNFIKGDINLIKAGSVLNIKSNIKVPIEIAVDT